MNENKTIINLAATMALKSTHFSGHRLGAVVHYGKRIISTGFNQNKSHPSVKQYNSTLRGLHAEMHATIGCGDLRQAQITVVRIRKDGSFGLAKPCEECRKFLWLRGIRKIYYSLEGKTYSSTAL